MTALQEAQIKGFVLPFNSKSKTYKFKIAFPAKEDYK